MTDIAGQAGLGFGFSGVVVNAAFSLGYSAAYQAAAECRATIHADLPGDNQALFAALLERAKTIDASGLQLPVNSVLDQRILDAAASLAGKLAGNGPKTAA